MAALTITAANVVKGAGAKTKKGVAGETLTAGQSIYKSTSDGRVYKADANASAATAKCEGITLHGALAGQPIEYQDGGILAFGAILTVGHIYVVGATAGDICPHGDLAQGWYTSILGVAVTTGNLQMSSDAWRGPDNPVIA